MIYLDNAATTLQKPEEVRRAVTEAFGRMGNSGRGAAEPALTAAETIYETREAFAGFFMQKAPEKSCLPQILQKR